MVGAEDVRGGRRLSSELSGAMSEESSSSPTPQASSSPWLPESTSRTPSYVSREADQRSSVSDEEGEEELLDDEDSSVVKREGAEQREEDDHLLETGQDDTKAAAQDETTAGLWTRRKSEVILNLHVVAALRVRTTGHPLQSTCIPEGMKQGAVDVPGAFGAAGSFSIAAVAWLPEEDPLEVFSLFQGVFWLPGWGSRVTTAVASRPCREKGAIGEDDVHFFQEFNVSVSALEQWPPSSRWQQQLKLQLQQQQRAAAAAGRKGLTAPHQQQQEKGETCSGEKEEEEKRQQPFEEDAAAVVQRGGCCPMLLVSLVQLHASLAHASDSCSSAFRQTDRQTEPRNLIGRPQVVTYDENPPLRILGTAILPLRELHRRRGEKIDKLALLRMHYDEAPPVELLPNGEHAILQPCPIFSHDVVRDIVAQYRHALQQQKPVPLWQLVQLHAPRLLHSVGRLLVSLDRIYFSSLCYPPPDLSRGWRLSQAAAAASSSDAVAAAAAARGRPPPAARGVWVEIDKVVNLLLPQQQLRQALAAEVAVVVMWAAEEGCASLFKRCSRRVEAAGRCRLQFSRHSAAAAAATAAEAQEHHYVSCSIRRQVFLPFLPGVDPLLRVFLLLNGRPFACLASPVDVSSFPRAHAAAEKVTAAARGKAAEPRSREAAAGAAGGGHEEGAAAAGLVVEQHEGSPAAAAAVGSRRNAGRGGGGAAATAGAAGASSHGEAALRPRGALGEPRGPPLHTTQQPQRPGRVSSSRSLRGVAADILPVGPHSFAAAAEAEEEEEEKTETAGAEDEDEEEADILVCPLQLLSNDAFESPLCCGWMGLRWCVTPPDGVFISATEWQQLLRRSCSFSPSFSPFSFGGIFTERKKKSGLASNAPDAYGGPFVGAFGRWTAFADDFLPSPHHQTQQQQLTLQQQQHSSQQQQHHKVLVADYEYCEDSAAAAHVGNLSGFFSPAAPLLKTSASSSGARTAASASAAAAEEEEEAWASSSQESSPVSSPRGVGPVCASQCAAVGEALHVGRVGQWEEFFLTLKNAAGETLLATAAAARRRKRIGERGSTGQVVPTGEGGAAAAARRRRERRSTEEDRRDDLETAEAAEKEEDNKVVVEEEGPHLICVKLEPLGNLDYLYSADPGAATPVPCIEAFRRDGRLRGSACTAGIVSSSKEIWEMPLQWYVEKRRGDSCCYKVKYMHDRPGYWLLHVTYGGLPIAGSPFELRLVTGNPTSDTCRVCGHVLRRCYASPSPLTGPMSSHKHPANAAAAPSNASCAAAGHCNAAAAATGRCNAAAADDNAAAAGCTTACEVIVTQPLPCALPETATAAAKGGRTAAAAAEEKEEEGGGSHGGVQLIHYINRFRVAVCDAAGNRVGCGGHCLSVKGENGAKILRVVDEGNGTFCVDFVVYVPKQLLQHADVLLLQQLDRHAAAAAATGLPEDSHSLPVDLLEKLEMLEETAGRCGFHREVKIHVYFYGKKIFGSPFTPLIANFLQLRRQYDALDLLSLVGQRVARFKKQLYAGEYVAAAKVLGEADEGLWQQQQQLKQQLMHALQRVYRRRVETEAEAQLHALQQQNRQQHLIRQTAAEVEAKKQRDIRNIQEQWQDLQVLREVLLRMSAAGGDRETVVKQFMAVMLQQLQRNHRASLLLLAKQNYLERIQRENILPLAELLQSKYAQMLQMVTQEIIRLVRSLEGKTFADFEDLLQIYRKIGNELRRLHRYRLADIFDQINGCLVEEMELQRLAHVTEAKEKKCAAIEAILQQKEDKLKEEQQRHMDNAKDIKPLNLEEIAELTITRRQVGVQTEDALSLREGIFGPLIVARATGRNLIRISDVVSAVKKAWRSCNVYDIHTTIQRLLKSCPRLKHCLSEVFLHYAKVPAAAVKNLENEGLPVGLPQTSFFRFCHDALLEEDFLSDPLELQTLFDKFSVEPDTSRVRVDGFMRVIPLFLWLPCLRELAYLNLLHALARESLSRGEDPGEVLLINHPSRLSAFYYFCERHFLPLYEELFGNEDFKVSYSPLLPPLAAAAEREKRRGSEEKGDEEGDSAAAATTSRLHALLQYSKENLPFDIFSLLRLKPMQHLFAFYSELSVAPYLSRYRSQPIFPTAAAAAKEGKRQAGAAAAASAARRTAKSRLLLPAAASLPPRAAAAGRGRGGGGGDACGRAAACVSPSVGVRRVRRGRGEEEGAAAAEGNEAAAVLSGSSKVGGLRAAAAQGISAGAAAQLPPADEAAKVKQQPHTDAIQEEDNEEEEEYILAGAWVSLGVFLQMLLEFGIVPGFLDADVALRIAQVAAERAGALHAAAGGSQQQQHGEEARGGGAAAADTKKKEGGMQTRRYPSTEEKKSEEERRKRRNAKAAAVAAGPLPQDTSPQICRSKPPEAAPAATAAKGRLPFPSFVEAIVNVICECTVNALLMETAPAACIDDVHAFPAEIKRKAASLLEVFGLNSLPRILLLTKRPLKSINNSTDDIITSSSVYGGAAS